MNSLATYRARWQAQTASARQFWQRSSARDKRILRIAAVLLPALLLWYGFIQPPLERINHWQAELPRLRTQAATLEAVLAEVQGATSALSGNDPQQALQQQLDSLGLAGHYQLSRDGQRWQLSVDNAAAEPLLNWLLDDAPRLGLQVRDAHLQRSAGQDSEAAPRVSGRVSMEQAPGAKESS